MTWNTATGQGKIGFLLKMLFFFNRRIIVQLRVLKFSPQVLNSFSEY